MLQAQRQIAQRLGKIWPQRQHVAKGIRAAGVVALFLENDSEMVMGLDIRWVEANGLLERFGCFCELAAVLQRASEVVVKLGPIVLAEDGPAITRNGRRQLALFQLGVSQVVMRFRVIWCQLEYPREPRFRFGHLIVLGQGICQAVQRIDVARVERNGRTITADGCGGVPLQRVGVAEVVLVVGRSRVPADRCIDQHDRGVVLTSLLRDHAKQMKRVRILGLQLQNFAIAARGFDQVACPMIFKPDRK